MKTQTDNNAIEKSILIAEFWGYKFHPADPWYKFGYLSHYWIKNHDNSIQRLKPEYFRFDSDWNWLIPVIKKISSMETNTSILKTAQSKFLENVKKEVLWDEIDKAIDCVVEFITIYNKNKI